MCAQDGSTGGGAAHWGWGGRGAFPSRGKGGTRRNVTRATRLAASVTSLREPHLYIPTVASRICKLDSKHKHPQLTLVMTVCPPCCLTKSLTGPDGAFSRVLPPVIAEGHALFRRGEHSQQRTDELGDS